MVDARVFGRSACQGGNLVNRLNGRTAVWVAIGIAMGAAIGAGSHKMIIWLIVGVIFGIAMARIAGRS